MTDKQLAKERAAFENDYRDLVKLEKIDNGDYISDRASDFYNGWLARAESALLAEAVAEAGDEVWASVPSTHDPKDATVKRHARALNDLGVALTAWREGRR